MFKIMIIEDNPHTLRLMDAVIRADGYNTVLAKDGKEALAAMEHNHVDLIVADLMMPNMDGYQFTAAIRDAGIKIPILMVSAKQDVADRKKGFLLGIDDYMCKPADEEEMLLRIKALLRRFEIINERKIVIGAVTLDYDSLTVTRENEQTLLPKKEFYLLYKLLSYPDKIFTRYQLMDEIWGIDSETDERTINVHINRLRERFKDYPEFEIETIRGLGYKGVNYEKK